MRQTSAPLAAVFWIGLLSDFWSNLNLLVSGGGAEEREHFAPSWATATSSRHKSHRSAIASSLRTEALSLINEGRFFFYCADFPLADFPILTRTKRGTGRRDILKQKALYGKHMKDEMKDWVSCRTRTPALVYSCLFIKLYCEIFVISYVRFHLFLPLFFFITLFTFCFSIAIILLLFAVFSFLVNLLAFNSFSM